jgi:hypothetical protein
MVMKTKIYLGEHSQMSAKNSFRITWHLLKNSSEIFVCEICLGMTKPNSRVNGVCSHGRIMLFRSHAHIWLGHQTPVNLFLFTDHRKERNIILNRLAQLYMTVSGCPGQGTVPHNPTRPHHTHPVLDPGAVVGIDEI